MIVKNQNLKFNNFYLFILFYTSLVVGFYLGEDLNFGATEDWLRTDFPVIKDLSFDLNNTLLNYESYGHRHSPVYLVFLSLLKNLGVSFDVLRFFHLNLAILLIYFFYKCLVLKFNNVEKSLLIILSLSIFAGRASDTGKDPIPEFKKSLKLAKKYKNVEILWASVREPYNYIQAKQLGCHIITVPPLIIEKIEKFGKSFDKLTLETVRAFLIDSKKSKFKI